MGALLTLAAVLLAARQSVHAAHPWPVAVADGCLLARRRNLYNPLQGRSPYSDA